MGRLKEVVVVDAVRSAIGKSGWKGMEKGGQLCQASAQDLMALPTPFKDNGLVSAGNSSQIVDGAACGPAHERGQGRGLGTRAPL